MGIKMNDKLVNYSHKPNKPNNKLVSVWLEHFCAQAHKTHKIHYGLDLGKPSPSPL
jgi:hypothetical protein